jgi:hypothetical protein
MKHIRLYEAFQEGTQEKIEIFTSPFIIVLTGPAESKDSAMFISTIIEDVLSRTKSLNQNPSLDDKRKIVSDIIENGLTWEAESLERIGWSISLEDTQ